MAVSKPLRLRILRRDGFKCQYCGARAPFVPLHVDHVFPQVMGGLDHPSNLVTACPDCNLGKGARLLESLDAQAIGGGAASVVGLGPAQPRWIGEPMSLMQWTRPESPSELRAYRDHLALLYDDETDYWDTHPTGEFHRAFSGCVPADMLTYRAFRAGWTPDRGNRESALAMLDGWPELFCAKCCEDERRELWFDFFGFEYGQEELVVD